MIELSGDDDDDPDDSPGRDPKSEHSLFREPLSIINTNDGWDCDVSLEGEGDDGILVTVVADNNDSSASLLPLMISSH